MFVSGGIPPTRRWLDITNCDIQLSTMTNNSLPTVPVERIEKSIYVIRGEKVMLDSDLAHIYGVSTANFNKAVKRNVDRFPADFMFRLNEEEFKSLIFQTGTSNKGRGGRRYLPYAFTEHGALMAANILNSPRAVAASLQVVRAFIKLRTMIISNAELSKKVDALEKKYDRQFKVVFDAIRQLMIPPEPKRKSIGFRTKGK